MGVNDMKLDESSMKLVAEWAYAEYMRTRADGTADHADAALAAADAAADRFELTDEDMYEIYDRLFHAAEDWAEWDIDVVRGWRTNYEMDQTEWLDHFFSSAASPDQRMLLITASCNTQAAAEAKLAALGN
jgi:hypothetical protein